MNYVYSGARIRFYVRNGGGPGGFLGRVTWKGRTWYTHTSNGMFKVISSSTGTKSCYNTYYPGKGPWGGYVSGYFPRSSAAYWIWPFYRKSAVYKRYCYR